jgi:hypothetical protein
MTLQLPRQRSRRGLMIPIADVKWHGGREIALL